jgi:hypothetical protein
MSRFSDIPNHTSDHAARAMLRIVELVETYLRHLRSAPSEESGDYAVTLVARSPASPAARALAAKADELGAEQVSANIIFAKPAPSDTLDDVLRAIRPVLRGEAVAARVRWARNPALLDAHEQLTLGSSICWSGDAMRRAPKRPQALEIAEESAPDAVRRASLAFSALWAASTPLTTSCRGEKRRVYDSLSDMAMAVHQRESDEVAIPSVSDTNTRH